MQRYVSGSLTGKANEQQKDLERENEKLEAKIGKLTMTIDLLKKVGTWKKHQACWVTFFFYFYTQALLAEPPQVLNDCYIRTTTKRRDILPYSIIEGSARLGGIQGDYLIDTDSDSISEFLKEAKRIGEDERSQSTHSNEYHVSGIPKVDFKIINDILALIHSKIPGWCYAEAPGGERYKEFSHLFRDKAKATQYIQNVPLSLYIQSIQHGVCRENGILLHLALKAAGIENKHLYVRGHTGHKFTANGTPDFNKTEDHAFVTITDPLGKEWVVDSWSSRFNGYPLQSLMRQDGINRKVEQEQLPITYSGYTDQAGAPVDRRGMPDFNFLAHVIHINDYPAIWIPKDNENCRIRIKKFVDEQIREAAVIILAHF